MGGRARSVSAFGGKNPVEDPHDFDVFRKGPGELWDVEESGAAGAQVGVSSPLPNPLLKEGRMGSFPTFSSFSVVRYIPKALDETES